MPDFADFAREVLAGFQETERKRIDRARKNWEFYRGDFSRYSPRVRVGIYQAARYERTSLLMRRVVEALAKHLYARGPARAIPDAEEVTAWLVEQYTREGVDAIMQEADRLACVGDVCAVQAVGTGDSVRPVRYHAWGAHQLVVFESATDPTRAEAVVTLDCFDQRTRATLWTADAIQQFATERGDQTAGGRAFLSLGPAEANPYGLLPFAFVHFNPPTADFWSGGPGDHLTEANDYINFFLTEIGDSVRYCSKPPIKAFGVKDGWTPPQPASPGDVWTVPPAYLDATGNGIPPEIDYLQADLGFVEAAWGDARSYLDHVLECNHCPPAEIRMEQAGAKSGVAIVMEQLPLILRAQGRQRDFLRYERDLARATIAVGSGYDFDLADALTLRWPGMLPDVPGATAAQDAADLEQLQTGQTSRVMIAMRKFNFTRDEAIAHLKAIAEDLGVEAKLGLPPITPPAATPGPDGAGPEIHDDAE